MPASAKVAEPRILVSALWALDLGGVTTGSALQADSLARGVVGGECNGTWVFLAVGFRVAACWAAPNWRPIAVIGGPWTGRVLGV